MKVEVNPGSVTGTPEKMRCGRVLRAQTTKILHNQLSVESKRAFFGIERYY